MSNRIKLSRDEFTLMFKEKCLPFLRVTTGDVGFDPFDTLEERLEKIYKAFNPDMPREITMNTSNGTTVYYCD